MVRNGSTPSTVLSYLSVVDTLLFVPFVWALGARYLLRFGLASRWLVVLFFWFPDCNKVKLAKGVMRRPPVLWRTIPLACIYCVLLLHSAPPPVAAFTPQ